MDVEFIIGFVSLNKASDLVVKNIGNLNKFRKTEMK